MTVIVACFGPPPGSGWPAEGTSTASRRAAGWTPTGCSCGCGRQTPQRFCAAAGLAGRRSWGRAVTVRAVPSEAVHSAGAYSVVARVRVGKGAVADAPVAVSGNSVGLVESLVAG